MANYADDFESYGTGSGIPTGYTGRWNYTSSEWDRVTDTDTAVRHVETSLIRGAVSYDTVDSDGNRANVDVLTLFKSTVGAGSDLRGGVVVRGSGSAGSETGYTCGIFGTELRIGKYSGGASSQPGITSGLGLSSSAVYYWIRFRVQNTSSPVSLKAKIWTGLETDEPGTWTLDVSDSTSPVTAAGWCGMFSFADGTKHWRDLAIATNGDTATMSTGPAAQTLSPSLLTNSQTFYAATVTTGAVALAPSLYSNAQTFYAHTLSQAGGGQTLTPSLYTNSQTFYGGSVGVGTVTLSPSLFTNSATFYGATVSQGAPTQTLSPSLLTNAQAFYGPTATVGAVTLLPGLFTNAQTFYSASLSGGIPLVRQKGLRKTRYTPGRVPPQLSELVRFLQSEIERINDGLESPFTHQLLEQLNTEPARKPGTQALIAYADGVNWNPGSGEGIYAYYAGSWNRLG